MITTLVVKTEASTNEQLAEIAQRELGVTVSEFWDHEPVNDFSFKSAASAKQSIRKLEKAWPRENLLAVITPGSLPNGEKVEGSWHVSLSQIEAAA